MNLDSHDSIIRALDSWTSHTTAALAGFVVAKRELMLANNRNRRVIAVMYEVQRLKMITLLDDYLTIDEALEAELMNFSSSESVRLEMVREKVGKILANMNDVFPPKL